MRMVRCKCWWGVLFLCWCFCACQERRYPRVLLQVDSLAEVAPDSALRLLNGWADSVLTVPEGVQMYYRLLTVKAADKAYIPHTSDSVIRRVVDYYEEEGNRRLLPEVYYYAGRVYRDLGDAPQALDYFERAAETFPPQGDKRLLGKIYSQTGTLFLYQEMYGEALEMYRKAYVCSMKAGNVKSQIYVLRDMGSAYEGLGQLDSALYYSQQAVDWAWEKGDTGMVYVAQAQMASLYLGLEQYDRVEAYLREAFKDTNRASRSGLYSMAAKLYYYTHRVDSAVYYWKKLLDCGTLYAKRTAHFGLAQNSLRLGDMETAMDHFIQYQVYDDSVHHLIDVETIRRAHSLYNYRLHEKENLRLKKEKLHRERWLYGSLSVCALLLVLGWAYIQYVRRKKSELAIRLEKANRIKDELQQRSEQFIRENEQKVAELERRLQDADDSLKAQLALQRERMIHENEQARASWEMQKQVATMIEKLDIRSELLGRLSVAGKDAKQLKRADWERIEKDIHALCPDFKEKLYMLYAGFSEHEYHICLLIKLGIRPGEIAILTAHSKESITAARRRMYKKVYGVEGEPRNWDDVIFSL